MRRLAGIALVLVLAALLYHAGPADAYVPAGHDLHGVEREYLALGDSLATGVGSSRCPIGCAGKAGYVAEYARRLEFSAGHSVSVRDLGVGGETTASFIGDYFSNPSSHSQLARAVAEIRVHGRSISPITLDIGGNDALNVRGPAHTQAEKQAQLDGVRRNLEQIISTLESELNAAGSHADMILLAYYQPFGENDPDFWRLAQLNQAIKDAGVAHALPVAEPYPAIAGKEQELTWAGCKCPIDVHPNDRGYELLAAELARVSYLPRVATGTVTGAVRDESGRPLAGATVWYGGGVTRTDARGTFRFEDVGAGTPLRFTAIDPATGEAASASVTAVAGKVISYDLRFGPGNEPPPPGDGKEVNTAGGYGRIGAALVRAGAGLAGAAAQRAADGGAAQVHHASQQAHSALSRFVSAAGGALKRLLP